MAYIPLIKKTKWIDLSDEHKLLRETLEADTNAACCENGHQQPIMLQGAFGIGKTTTLFYLFHYAWEVLKVPTFYMTLSAIVDRVKDKASESDSGKVENSEISKIISEMIDEQMSLLKDINDEEQNDLFFPDYAEGNSLNEYLKDFTPVELSIEGDISKYSDLSHSFTLDVIKAGIRSGHKPLLLVDEFESKFYELKKYVEASGGGILRDLFDQIVQNCPFYLVIGNGPASGYAIAKEQSDIVGNDSETAASRRLKPLAVPFPTVNLLVKKFLCGQPKGFVNFIWWMSRCRPGHIQKLNDALKYETLQDSSSATFLTQKIFKESIDESGEEVTYLKVEHFNNIDSYLLPLFTELLLNFEPRPINISKTYKDALRASTNDFFCTSKNDLVSVENSLLPALSDDVKKILSQEQDKGKFDGVNYIEHIYKYFHYILSALSNKNDEVAFSMVGDKQKDETFALTFLIPLFELSYDFISQYEDDSEDKTKNTKDFLLECINLIENGLKNENLDEKFENTYDLFGTCKVKEDTELYLQFSLNTVREIIEQPIGSPVLTYKNRALSNELKEVDFEEATLIKAEHSDNTIFFIPNLEERDLELYLSRCQTLLQHFLDEAHENANKVIRIVYLADSDLIEDFKKDILYYDDDDNDNIPIAKLKKIDIRNFDSYQFNFGGQISDFIDSLCKIALVGVSNGDLNEDEENCIDITELIDAISDRNWTPKKEVVRTIEHYGKLLNEGDNAVVNSICALSNNEFMDILESKVCSRDDYDDNSSDWNLDKNIDDSLHLLSKRLVQLYLTEITKEPAEKRHISERFMNILELIGRKSSPIFIEADEDSIPTSVKYNDMLSILSDDNCSSVIDGIDLKSDLVKRLKSLCELMHEEEAFSSTTDAFEFFNSKFEKHWIQSYGRRLSSWGSARGDIFIKLLYCLCDIELIDTESARNNQVVDLRNIESEVAKLRESIRENATELKDLVFPQKTKNDKKDFFGVYLTELAKVSSLIANIKQLLDEESDKFSILMFTESLLLHLQKIVETAQTFSSQVYSILSRLKGVKTSVSMSFQDEIDRINNDVLSKKLIEIDNKENNKQHLNYDDDALWKIFIGRVRNDDSFKECLSKAYHPAHLMLIEQKELQDIFGVINNKNNSVQSTFSEILTSCREKNKKADEINNLIEWTKELIGLDNDE